jgi:uncharacterized protein YeaO (DUF488 family)
MKNKIKRIRVYEMEDCPKEGRFLVDKVWPRGVKKEKLEPFYRAKEITPSTKLRKWFGHKEENFSKFKEKYLEELENNPAKEDFLQKAKETLEKSDLILLYAAKDEKINHVVILQERIEDHLK